MEQLLKMQNTSFFGKKKMANGNCTEIVLTLIRLQLLQQNNLIEFNIKNGSYFYEPFLFALFIATSIINN